MPSGTFLSFVEPHQYQQRIRPADAQIIPTTRGKFRATLSQVNLHHLTLQHGWQNLPTVARSALHQDRASIMFLSGSVQSTVRIDGIDLVPDVLALGAPGEEHFFQGLADCSWATLTLTPETYAAARTALLGDDTSTVIRGNVARPSLPSLGRLRTLHSRIMALVRDADDHGAHPEVARAAEHALLGAVVDCLATEDDALVSRLGHRNGTAVMRKLYDLLDENEGLPLYLMEVCASLGVSRRALYAACTEHLGLSPHRFLWLRRMQLARLALMEADARTATVTQIATDLGFWELGRFSVRYKWLFGESPSITLGRPRVRTARRLLPLR